MFCLTGKFVEQLKEAIRRGTLSPEKLNDMTSQQRRDFLETIIGKENAQPVNLLFEQKLLLKNQEKAMYDWAREITGMSKADKAKTLEKIKQTFADKNKRLYDPKENENFLNEITADTYSKKYKTEVSLDEAQTITELAQNLKEAKDKVGENLTDKSIDDGVAKVALENYIGALKLEANKRPLINIFKEQGIKEKLIGTLENARISANFIAENSRALKASWDNSFWGRQGIKVLFNPKYSKIWARNFLKSFIDIGTVLKGGNKSADALVDATKANIYSRENYRNGRYQLGKKLDLTTGEEAFPTSQPSKIPIFGRVFRASEVAYELGAMRLRADIADQLYKLAEKTGVDLADKREVGSINELTNSLTGRGSLGRNENIGKVLNKAFFSAKFFKSNLDFLTLHAGSDMSAFARKQAATNLLMTASTIGVILSIAKAIDPDSVEFDPRSSNFGKIRIGDTRFDITGGLSPLVTLAFRIARQSSKSSTGGTISRFGEGYGSQSGMEALWNFTENKFSPIFTVIKDLVNQKDFMGRKPTILGELKNLTVPMIASTAYEAATNDRSAGLLLALIADGLGISTNTYSFEDDWNVDIGKELQQFKDRVGEQRFKDANTSYNKRVNDLINSEKYKSLEGDKKKEYLTEQKAKIKEQVFKNYQFKYRLPSKR